jgi:hypothetical protein
MSVHRGPAQQLEDSRVGSNHSLIDEPTGDGLIGHWTTAVGLTDYWSTGR